jgi:hypothetical protein
MAPREICGVASRARLFEIGLPKNWIAADTARIANSVLVGHGDVMQDEATVARPRSRLAMFGGEFLERRRTALGNGLPTDIGISERGQRIGRNVAVWLPNPSSHRLRRPPKCAHECPSHSFAICKARVPRDGFDRMPAVLQHQPSGLKTKFLDGLCRRLAGLGRKSARKLARTQTGYVRKFFNRKLSV